MFTNLVKNLLNTNHNYIFTARIESDPIKRHFGKSRPASGGRFLISMKKVNNSEKILAFNSIVNDDINFWEENIYTDDNTDDVTMELRTKTDEI